MHASILKLVDSQFSLMFAMRTRPQIYDSSPPPSFPWTFATEHRPRWKKKAMGPKRPAPGSTGSSRAGALGADAKETGIALLSVLSLQCFC